MSVVIQMPRRLKNEAVEALEEMLELARADEPSGIVLMVRFGSGAYQVGASGQFLRDPARMDDAVSRLRNYFGKRRRVG